MGSAEASRTDRADDSARLAVSVIVAVYNGEDEIEPLLASLAGQSLPPDEFEIIVVDDDSTDATLTRLRRFESEHGNVTVVHNSPNSGWPGRARNLGLDRARGEYVFFADHDDYLALDALETMHRFARAHDTDVLLGKEVGIGQVVPWSTFRHTMPKMTLDDERLVRILTPHKLFRRALLEQHGIRFPEGDVRLEDNQFVLRTYFAADVISIYSDTACYFWVRRASRNNISSRKVDRRKYLRDVDKVLQIVEENTEPGETRDGLYLHWYRRKMLRGIASASFSRATPAEQRTQVETLRDLVNQRIAPALDTRMSHAEQVRAHLVRAGDVTALVDLATQDAGMTSTVEPAQVHWDGDALAVTARATLTYADGAPVLFERVGERIERVRLDLPDDRLPAQVRDVAAWAGDVGGGFVLRDRATNELAEIVTEREGGFVAHGDHLVLTMTARGRVDVDTGFNSRPLPKVVDALLRFGALGWNSERRVPMDTSAPDGGLVHDIGATRFLAYGTEGYGKLSVRRSAKPKPAPPPAPKRVDPPRSPAERAARRVARVVRKAAHRGAGRRPAP